MDRFHTPPWFDEVYSGITIYRRPCVYAWFRGKHCLYVGMSTRGIARVFGAKHHVIWNICDVLPGDQIKVFFPPTANVNELRAIEKSYIEELKPYFNQGGEYERRIRERRKKVSELRNFLCSEKNMAEVLYRQVQERFLLEDAHGDQKTLDGLRDEEIEKIGCMIECFKEAMRVSNAVERERYE